MNQNPKGDEVAVVGVALIGLFKCEEEECGTLFVREVDYLFQQPGAEPETVAIACPAGHKRVKFIQSIDKAPLVPPNQ